MARWSTSTCAIWARPSCASGCRRSTNWPRSTWVSIRRTTPIPVRPAVHYTMGGIETDGRTAPSPLPGLYAVGECASVGIHGANRLGSNSLTELLVFGKRRRRTRRRDTLRPAAPAARRSGTGRRRADSRRAGAGDATRRHGAHRRPARATWRRPWKTGCGIYRTAARRCRPTCDKLQSCASASGQVAGRRPLAASGTPSGCALELGFLLDVAEAMAHSALKRQESRGAHQRLDGYEQRDDVNFLQHTLATTTARRRRASTTARSRSPVASPARAPTARPAKRREAERRPGAPLADGETIEIDVLRYRPSRIPNRVLQRFEVPFSDDMSVLQALQYIKDDLDGTLSFRWSCRMAICGSCG